MKNLLAVLLILLFTNVTAKSLSQAENQCGQQFNSCVNKSHCMSTNDDSCYQKCFNNSKKCRFLKKVDFAEADCRGFMPSCILRSEKQYCHHCLNPGQESTKHCKECKAIISAFCYNYYNQQGICINS